MGDRSWWLPVACSLSLWLGAPDTAARAPTAVTPSAVTPSAVTPSAADTEASVQLFREGRSLLSQGRTDEACERFQAALERRRSAGTLLNVGNCLQSRGQLLGARQVFEETAALARSEPDAAKAEVWSDAARQELETLEPRIPHLLVQAPADSAIEVQLDGAPFRAFGAPHALDPGTHRIVARAPGKLDFTRELTLAEGQSLALEIPVLEPVPAAVVAPVASAAAVDPTPATPAAQAEDTSSSKVVPWTLVGVGGAVLAGGIVTGLVAAHRASDLESDCPNHVCEGDLSQPDEARDTAVVADILMGTGLVLAGAGVTWLVLTKDDDASATSFSAACLLDGCAATLRGRF